MYDKRVVFWQLVVAFTGILVGFLMGGLCIGGGILIGSLVCIFVLTPFFQFVTLME